MPLFTSATRPSLKTVLICGGLVVSMSMGIRHGFGFFNLPITQAHGWTRETFALAIALQNLFWGLTQPVVGAIADRFGPLRVMIVGTLLYVSGLVLMAISSSSIGFLASAGLCIGLAQSGTTYSVIYAIIGRVAPPEKRMMAMGITAAAGSFGQFIMIPIQQSLIAQFGWQEALFILASLAALMLPLIFGLKEPAAESHHTANDQTISQALKEALTYRSFQLLMMGYFVCGFQVVFIAVHLPAYLKDKGMLDAKVATIALALIGLFNIFGTYGYGWMAQRLPKRYLLCSIYSLRAVCISLFILLPLSSLSVWVFASVMGILWLSTIPVTNGVIVQIFGIKHLSMLSGFVFMAHQFGSFLGAWLGGFLYDRLGSYDLMWMIAIALGVFAGLINLPINERTIVRNSPLIT
ncbi:MFS transporter [Ampullimonas aquatilis]|uniref:MFS transporter n=1 Tax=Ampullimonas aquatilis TaxID=1341549 RepID=UPI003C711960